MDIANGAKAFGSPFPPMRKTSSRPLEVKESFGMRKKRTTDKKAVSEAKY